MVKNKNQQKQTSVVYVLFVRCSTRASFIINIFHKQLPMQEREGKIFFKDFESEIVKQNI